MSIGLIVLSHEDEDAAETQEPSVAECVEKHTFATMKWTNGAFILSLDGEPKDFRGRLQFRAISAVAANQPNEEDSSSKK